MPNPRLRRRARERAMQFLFGLDFTRNDWHPALELFWEANPSRPGARKYAQKLIRGIAERREEIDEALAGALENWRPERVSRTEWNVLRIALYEMRYADDVPENVAINEAIEVAKRYGSDGGPQFVNGVLDRLKEGKSRPTDL